MFLWLCAENDRCRRIPPWFGKILRDTDISVWVRGKSIQDCQRRSGQSFKLYENHRWNIEGEGTSYRYRESGSDPYLFRCEIWACKGSSCRNYLCSDRPFPDTSGTGLWDWTGIWDAGSGTCIKLQNSASWGLWCSPDAEETQRAGRGGTGASHCMEWAAWRNPCHADGWGSDWDIKASDLGAFPCSSRVWHRKYRI